MNALMSLDEAAKRLGVSRFSVYSWSRKGLLRTVKLGRRRLVPEDEVTRVVKDGLNDREKVSI